MMLPVEGHHLQSLECQLFPLDPRDDESIGYWQSRIGRLTALTRLELRNFRPNRHTSFPLMRNLHLQELVLVECQRLELQLIVPGSFTSLRKLHIEEAIEGPHHTDGQLLSCGRKLISLPQLSQLSGSCALFDIGLRHELRGWQVNAYERGLMTSNNLPEHVLRSSRKVWIRF